MSTLDFRVGDFLRGSRSECSPQSKGTGSTSSQATGRVGNLGRVTVASFNRVRNELHSTIADQNVTTALVAAARWCDSRCTATRCR